MIRCIIVDDKPLAIDILAAYTEKIPWLELVFRTQNPLEALEYLHQHPADLVFLDIQMPELNGLQFIQLGGGRIPIILTTAYPDYALEGYAYDVVDYLLKPISFERFYQAVEKARTRLLTPAPTAVSADLPSQSIFIKTEHKLQRIALEDILYIEARQNYIAIETSAGRVMSLQNIKTVEDKLPPAWFIRVHKSFIVSLEKIDTIEKNRIFIGTTVLPIGDSYRENLFKRLRS